MGVMLFNYFNTFTATEKYNLFNIIIFKALFFSSMFVSTNIFILFLNNTQQQNYISIYYTTMAFIGIGAIFLVKIFDKFKPKNIIKFGTLLYALGLILRAYPNNIIIIITSAISTAIGANLVILGSRLWMLYFSDTTVRSKAITTINNIIATIKSIVLYIVSFIIIFGYKLPLLLIGLVVILAMFFVPDIQIVNNKNKTVSVKTPLKVLVMFAIVNFIAGIVAFIVVTLLPIFLHNKGLNESNVLIYIATLGIISIILSFFVSSKINNYNLIKIYYIYCILISAMLFVILNNSLIGYLIILILFIVKMLIGSIGIAAELIDNAIAQKYNPALLLALMQSSGLAGTFIAGMFSMYIINNNLTTVVLLSLCSLLFIINISMVWLFNFANKSH